jgi:hypothetical protein
VADHVVDKRGRIVRSRGPIIRGIILGYLILSIGVVSALWRVESLRREADHKIAAQTLARNQAIAAQALETCREVEKIKYRIRYTARKNYNQLKQNAKLLDIPLTNALRQRALEDRNATLRRYHREQCPRQLHPDPDAGKQPING